MNHEIRWNQGKSNSLFYPTTAPPRAETDPHTPRCTPWRTPCQGVPEAPRATRTGTGDGEAWATLPVGPDSNMMRAIEENDFSNWCKVQMLRTMRGAHL